MNKRLVGIFTVIIAIVGIGWALERSAKSAPMADKVVGSGTAGRISKWLTSDTIGDSTIIEDRNGLIGIGTNPNPLAQLLVVANVDQPNSAIRGINSGTGRGVTGVSENGIGVNGGGKIGVNGVSTSSDPNDAGVRGVSSGAAW